MGAAAGHLGVGAECRCGGNLAKHSVPGFDGECTHCEHCREYRPRTQTATARTPVVARRALVGVPWVSVQVAEIEQERRRGQQGTPDRQGRRA